MRKNKKLYEQIMYVVSKEIKRILNEEIQNFNPSDFQNDESDIIDTHVITDICSLDPKQIKAIKKYTEEDIQDAIDDSGPREWIYDDFIYTEYGEDSFYAHSNIFENQWEMGLSDILDPSGKFEDGTEYFESLPYETKQQIVKYVNETVNEILDPDDDWTKYVDDEYLEAWKEQNGEW